MGRMFAYCKSFDGDLSKWDVSAVTDMNHMFYLATSFSRDLSSWDVSFVKTMHEMFFGATSFDKKLCWKSDLSGVQTKRMFHSSPGSVTNDCPQEGATATGTQPWKGVEQEL